MSTLPGPPQRGEQPFFVLVCERTGNARIVLRLPGGDPGGVGETREKAPVGNGRGLFVAVELATD